jgi:hypothetical protein
MGSSGDGDLQRQIDELVAQVASNRARIDQIQADSLVDRELIAQLQADGALGRDHVAQLEKALLSSRQIGAAVGILMGSRQVTQDEALTILKATSQRSNRKLYDVAAELVESANRRVTSS